MHIAYYSYDHLKNPSCGGGGSYRDTTIHRLLADRHTITHYCGKFKGANTYKKDGIQYHFLGSGFNYLLSRISFALFATIHSLFVKADIIVICFSVYSPVFTFALRKKKTVVEFFHFTSNTPFKKYSIFGVLPFCAEYAAIALGGNFICINTKVAESIRLRNRSCTISIVYTGFDADIFSKNKTHDNYVLYLGRIDIYMKGIDILLDSFDTIAARFPAYRLILAGRGSKHDISWLHNRIMQSPYAERITFKENIDDSEKVGLLQKATVVCVPSRFEGWCIVAIEAAASSKPTLGTNINGLSESIMNNKTGILVESENTQEYGKALALLLGDESSRKSLGSNGYHWAKNFTWDKIAIEQEKVYVSALHRLHGKN